MAVEGAGLNIPEGIKKGDTIKFVGDATDPFPKLQRKCGYAKASLTKALTALEKSSLRFGSLTSEEELLTSQRHARTFMEDLEKVETKKTELETCFENLIGHVNNMAREDFEPNTDPGAVADSADHSCQERLTNANERVDKQEDLVKKAEQVLSLQLQLKAVVPGPPQAGPSAGPSGPTSAALPVFRPLSDLKPSPIEKNSTFREIVHFVEVFTSRLVMAGQTVYLNPW